MDITFYYGITTRKTQAGVTNVQRDDGPILDFSQARYHGKVMLRATSIVSAWARDMLPPPPPPHARAWITHLLPMPRVVVVQAACGNHPRRLVRFCVSQSIRISIRGKFR
jgi:hypothetical protein